MGNSRIVIVTGTGTDVGKTVATAALASVLKEEGKRVGLCKPVQTGLSEGEAGDVDDAAQLAGISSNVELYRYPEPLAPETAARRAGMAAPTLDELCSGIEKFAAGVDVALVEGAGGVLVRLGPDLTIIDVAVELSSRGHRVSAVIVNRAALGTLSDTELAVDRLRSEGIEVAGTVIGLWPEQPDLAERCNLDDLERLTGVPILGKLPAGAGSFGPAHFRAEARKWLEGGAVHLPE